MLDREAESDRQIYESLLRRANETGVTGELRTSNIRIVDSAEVPRRPTSPNHGLNLLVALLVGGSLAIGVVFFFEYMDDRIKTPDDLRSYLGLAALGWVPKLKRPASSRGYPLITDGNQTSLIETFRIIRTNVLFSFTEEGTRSLVVSSSVPGEGKTTVACNLAVSLAQTSERVLLIDADLRLGKVHVAFGQKREPGLSNVIVGDSKVSEAVHKSRIQGLWTLSSGRVPPNPTELLGSKRFGDFMGSLHDHFDWVLLDTPPAMAVADASVVSKQVGAVLFVVAADQTSRRVASRAVDKLKPGASSVVIGAVLNRMDVRANPYYYGLYHRSDYEAYYGESSDKVSRPA